MHGFVKQVYSIIMVMYLYNYSYTIKLAFLVNYRLYQQNHRQYDLQDINGLGHNVLSLNQVSYNYSTARFKLYKYTRTESDCMQY